jgi:ABC-type Zn uptake system ZnuABC Zn-binding protein ZnuA
MKNDSVIITKLFLIVWIFLFFSSPMPSYASDQDNISQQIAQKLNLVTSVVNINNIVQNIGVKKVDLIGLDPEEVNSHKFEMIPSDILIINYADLIIIDGLNLEAEIETRDKLIEMDPSNS